MAYVTLQTMKTYVGWNSEDTGREALLSAALASAESEVERRCGRTFLQDASATARTFDCEANGILFVDDMSVTTGILIDGVALTSDDKLFPRNGIVDGQSGHPYTYIESDTFIEGEEYSITARWGWAAVPPVVIEVVKMLAAETYTLRGAPLGVKEVNLFGPVRVRESVHIKGKLKRYSKNPEML